MRKVRSFDQNPPVHPATAHPVYLLALRRLPQGSCFTLHPQLYGGYTYPRNCFSHARSGSGSAHKKGTLAGALCARSVASADLHRHTRYGSPSIPPRLTATTSGFLLYLAPSTIRRLYLPPQLFQSCAVWVRFGAQKRHPCGCLMCKVRSFGRPTSAYPLRLTQYTSSPYGDYLRVLALPC